MPPQISGCSSASDRPRPHSTAWPGLARSPSEMGWALRVMMNNFGGEIAVALLATIAAASRRVAWKTW
ncbi:Uncharacterised protein [Mycobacterium tuberculosis]|nr:Uncharacterised protein [Mycobacterium tuberculosis]CKU48024.1 Uncharacterised protein [Mycobacterium tuberculosis]CNV53359.1 Uncharacterised protein [Mycobacterium tuberculosis]